MDGAGPWPVTQRSWQPAAWTAFALVASAIIAVAVVQGRTTTWFGLVTLSAAIALSSLQRTTRLRALMFAILVSPLLFGPSVPIPLELTLSEALLFFVVLSEVMAGGLRSRGDYSMIATRPSYYGPFVLFALFGLVSTYLNGEWLSWWPTVCLLPLVILFSVDRLTVNSNEAFGLVRAAVAAILVYAAIVWVAGVTGPGPLLQGGWRLGAADATATLGPLSFRVFSISLGSLIAMGVPAVSVLAARAPMRRQRSVYVAAAIALLGTLALTFSIAATVGAVLGVAVAMLISRRVRAMPLVFGAAFVLLFAAVAGPALLSVLPNQGVEHFAGLRYGTAFPNVAYRLNAIGVTLREIPSTPLGPGFAYLWERYRLDEAIVYSMILNGTGILGLCAFVAMLVQLARSYLSDLFRHVVEARADLSAIGLGTLITAVTAGVADSSVFTEPVQATVFWVICAATATGCLRRPACRPTGRGVPHESCAERDACG